MAEVIVLTVAAEEAGQRLDSWVSASVGRSRSQVRRWIEAGRVRVEGRVRKAGFGLSPGQQVEVEPMTPEPTELIAEDLPLDILYEDDDLLVVNKAAGMVVHPGAGNRRGTLANALAHHLGKLAHGDPLRPGIVHRLDKGTSGILLVARNETAHESLAAQFKRREVEKVYLALVHGQAARAGEVVLPIGRDFRSRLKISTRTRRPREAITRYEAVRWWRWATLLRVFPQTGRTHQIRVHLLESGHPVVGDPLYRRRDRVLHGPWAKQERELNRLFLHATSLRFLHPTSGREMCFEAPIPAELEAFLSRLEE